VRRCSAARTANEVKERRTASHPKCRLPDKDTMKKNSMQNISSQTPEGIVGNGGILEVTVTVNAGKRTEDDSVKSGEWSREYQGITERYKSAGCRAWNGSPEKRPKPTSMECCG
jgi:hypothetical protein